MPATHEPSRPIIRPATPGDVTGVLPMVRAICDEHQALDPARYAMLPDVVDRYARWLPIRATDDRSVFLVADAGGRAVGFIVATIETSIPIYALSEFAFIHDVYVKLEFRRRGVAGSLVQAACEMFRAKGVAQVRLETAGANDQARALFESQGFRVATIDMLREMHGPGPSPAPAP